MKLIFKLDPTISQLMKSLKRKINYLIFCWFKSPYQTYIRKRQEIKKAEANRKDFVKKFNVEPSKIVDIIRRNQFSIGLMKKSSNVKMTDEEYKFFLAEEIKKSAISINKMKPFIKASLFYEPEISDIHNESLEDNRGPSFNELVASETSKSGYILRSQEKNHGGVLDIVKKSNTTKDPIVAENLKFDHNVFWDKIKSPNFEYSKCDKTKEK